MLNGFMFTLGIKQEKLMVIFIGLEAKLLNQSHLQLLKQSFKKLFNSNLVYGQDIKDLMELLQILELY